MPQPKSRSTTSGSSSKPKPARASTKRSSATKASGASAKRSSATKASGASAKRSGATKASGASAKRSSATKASGATKASSAKATAAGPEARFEAAAARLRKLNERIIDSGRDAGEATLSSYEKALTAIANSIERGPGSSDIDWISHLATTQAKFIRDVTKAWTSAARGVLK